MTWEEIIDILEKNKDKSTKELIPIFNKDRVWTSRLKTFYFASKEEKEALKDKHPQFAYFYRLYKEYLERNTPKIKEEKEKKEEIKITNEENIEQYIEDPELIDEEELEQKVEILKKVMIFLGTKLKRCKKLKDELLKENEDKALNLNRTINELQQAKIEIEEKKKAIKYLNIIIYISGGLNIATLILFAIKG